MIVSRVIDPFLVIITGILPLVTMSAIRAQGLAVLHSMLEHLYPKYHSSSLGASTFSYTVYMTAVCGWCQTFTGLLVTI